MKWAIFVLYGSLEDIARGRSDGDDVGARWQGGDAEGVVGAVHLSTDLDCIGHWRGNLHVIVVYHSATIDCNLLGLNIILIICRRHIVVHLNTITRASLVFKVNRLLMVFSKKRHCHRY